MVNTLHYTMRSTSLTGTLINQTSTYDVYYDATKGIAYEVILQAPLGYSEEIAKLPAAPEGALGTAGLPVTPSAEPQPSIAPQELVTWWHGRIFNDLGQKRLEYDVLKRIYYQTRQTIQVESALYNLQEDLQKFMAANPRPVAPMDVGGGVSYPGYQIYTLTIWIDPNKMLPMRRLNTDRGFTIIDDFIYYAVNTPLPDEVFSLPKPAEAIADFDLYPEAPTLPRFEIVGDANSPQYGVYVQTLIEEIKRHVILNQWEYGPFATIDLPWLVEMPVTIYRRISTDAFPPLVVAVNAPLMRTVYFLVTYDFLGYVVAGFTQNTYNLSKYEQLPITAIMELRDLIPLYAAPSFEKQFVVENFITSVQSNDFFINAFKMGGKTFDLIIKNFSFHENEGYLILNVYGKEYWDNANIEAMFNFVVTGSFSDGHTTPIQVYTINTMKRLGIYQKITMPVYEEIPAGGSAPAGMAETVGGALTPSPVPTPIFTVQGTE